MSEPANTAEVELTREDGSVTLRCSGALDLHNCQQFRDLLKEVSSTADNVVVDFTAVDYIDTAVLAHLAVAANKMIARDRRLQVRVLEPSHPHRTLRITGFAAVMDVIPVAKQ